MVNLESETSQPRNIPIPHAMTTKPASDLDLTRTFLYESRDCPTLFSIGKNAELQLSPNHVKAGEETFILGSLFGSILDGRILNQQETIQAIHRNLDNRPALFRILRKLMGPCEIILKNADRVFVICSPSSPGIFYTQKDHRVFLSRHESEIYRYGDALDEWEAINLVISHHGLRSPYSSVYKNVKRIIGGQLMSVSFDLTQLDTPVFLFHDLTKVSTETHGNESYGEFESLLEKEADLILKNWKEDNHFLLLSGGIDSATLFLAFRKLSERIRSIHFDTADQPMEMCRRLTEKFEAELISFRVSNPLSQPEKEKNIKKLYELGLNAASYFRSVALGLADYLPKIGIKNPLILSGQNMDSLYFIDTFAPSFYTLGHSYYRGLWRGSRFRYLYTDIFFRSLGSKLGKTAFSTLHRQPSSANFNFASYLESIVLPNHEHSIPMVSSLELTPSLSPIVDDYREFKRRSIFLPFLRHFGLDEQQIEDTSWQAKNHMVRMLKRTRFVQAVSLNYLSGDRLGGLNHILPISEGPISDYFSTFCLNSSDAFHVKPMLHRYFLKNFGTSYYETKRPIIEKSRGSLMTRVNRRIKQKLHPEPAPLPYMTQYLQNEIKDFAITIKNLLGKECCLADNSRQKTIQQYFAGLHQKATTGDFRSISRSEVVEIERFANLEIMLRKSRGA